METKARIKSYVTRHFLWEEDKDFNRREKTTCIGGSERMVIDIRIVMYAQFSTRNGHRCWSIKCGLSKSQSSTNRKRRRGQLIAMSLAKVCGSEGIEQKKD